MATATLQKSLQIKIFSPTDDLIAILTDTDETGNTLNLQLNIDKIGGLNTFQFDLSKNTDKPITENSQCYFYYNNNLLDIGYISEIPLPDIDKNILKMKGKGFIHKLNDKVISATYTAQTLDAIIKDIANSYLGSDIDIYYAVAKITVPAITNISITFKDKNLLTVFNALLSIANKSYDTANYRLYIDTTKDLVFEQISNTTQRYLWEGYHYNNPDTSIVTSHIINKIQAYRSRSDTPKDIEYVGVYEDTESQGKYGLREKKITLSDYTDTTSIENMMTGILKQWSEPKIKIKCNDYNTKDILSFGNYALNNRRKKYWQQIAETDSLTNWDDSNLTSSTLSLDTTKVLTGRRSLKLVTTVTSNGDYATYTLDNILSFPLLLKFFVYFDTTAIDASIIIVDKNLAELEIPIDKIANEWIKISETINLTTEIGTLKVNYDAITEGYFKLNYDVANEGYYQVRKLINNGVDSIKAIKIKIKENIATTFYIDLFYAYADIYKQYILPLEQIRYNVSLNTILADLFFSDAEDSIIKEINKKSTAGETIYDAATKQGTGIWYSIDSSGNLILTSPTGNVELKPASGKRIVFDDGETWHEVGGSGEPAFENGWVTWSVDPLRFRLDAEHYLHIEGVADNRSATAGTVFTLPVGYRPDTRRDFPVIGYYGGVAVLDGYGTVNTDGSVTAAYSNTTQYLKMFNRITHI